MSAVPGVDHDVAASSLRALATESKASNPSPRACSGRTLLAAVAQRLALWQQKRASRKALLNLTDAELADIGVTRSEARNEAGRSFFWD